METASRTYRLELIVMVWLPFAMFDCASEVMSHSAIQMRVTESVDRVISVTLHAGGSAVTPDSVKANKRERSRSVARRQRLASIQSKHVEVGVIALGQASARDQIR